MVLFVGKTVWSMSERFANMRAYLKALYKYYLPFLSFPAKIYLHFHFHERFDIWCETWLQSFGIWRKWGLEIWLNDFKILFWKDLRSECDFDICLLPTDTRLPGLFSVRALCIIRSIWKYFQAFVWLFGCLMKHALKRLLFIIWQPVAYPAISSLIGNINLTKF